MAQLNKKIGKNLVNKSFLLVNFTNQRMYTKTDN